jgi:AAA family ATP:ADP antiporter
VNSDTITRFFLFGGLLFLLTFVYLITRDIKDVLIISAADATLLPELKSLITFPKILVFGLFLIFYRKPNLPYIMMIFLGALLLYFIIFHFWLFPHSQQLHMTADEILHWSQIHNLDLSVARVWGMWSYSLYYILADLWAILAIGFLFWALANQTFSMQEAKLAYPLMAIFPSLGLYLSGRLMHAFSMVGSAQGFENVLHKEGFILIGILVLFALLAWVMRMTRATTLLETASTNVTSLSSLSFKTSYIFLILIIVSSFGLCSYLVTTIMKDQLRNLYSSPIEYAEFMGQYSLRVGWVSFVLYVLTCWMVWAFGWLRSALITPILTLIGVVALLALKFFPAVTDSIAQTFHTSSPALLVELVAMLNIVMIGVKATLFNTTKDLAFMPLATTTKARGKAVVDLLFAGIGTWLGAQIIASQLMRGDANTNLNEFTSTFLMIALIASIVWIISVIVLGKMYQKIGGQ